MLAPCILTTPMDNGVKSIRHGGGLTLQIPFPTFLLRNFRKYVTDLRFDRPIVPKISFHFRPDSTFLFSVGVACLHSENCHMFQVG